MLNSIQSPYMNSKFKISNTLKILNKKYTNSDNF